MDHERHHDQGSDGAISRRRLLKGGAALGAAVWAAPAVVKVSRATAQASPIADPCTEPCGPPFCGENLLTNPGAEDTVGLDPVRPAAWSVSGDLRSIEYGATDDYMSAFTQLADTGNRYFGIGPGTGAGIAEGTQVIDLSSLTDLFTCRCITVGVSLIAGSTGDGSVSIELVFDDLPFSFSFHPGEGWQLHTASVTRVGIGSPCVRPTDTLTVRIGLERTAGGHRTAMDNVEVLLLDGGPLP